MKVMKIATKEKYVLLDADIIIKAHEQKLWDLMLEKLDLKVPSIVVNEAHQYFSNEESKLQYPIDLQRLVNEGAIEMFSASNEDVYNLKKQFDNSFELDAGEEEAIALLFAGKAEGAKFCTADGAAIQALALLQLSEHGVSLETILKRNGISCKITYSCSKKHFQKHLAKGNERFIRRDGLANKKI